MGISGLRKVEDFCVSKDGKLLGFIDGHVVKSIREVNDGSEYINSKGLEDHRPKQDWPTHPTKDGDVLLVEAPKGQLKVPFPVDIVAFITYMANQTDLKKVKRASDMHSKVMCTHGVARMCGACSGNQAVMLQNWLG